MWCQTTQIGNKATVAHLQAIDEVFNSVGLYLYKPEQTYYLRNLAVSGRPENKSYIDLGRAVISADNFKLYYTGVWLGSMDIALDRIEDRRYAVLDEIIYPFSSLSYDAVAGLAQLTDVTEVAVGDSIIRDGQEVVVTALPFALMADDMLAVPPSGLTRCAISVGRRIMKLETDQKATWDNASCGRNRLLDGWEDVINIYRD